MSAGLTMRGIDVTGFPAVMNAATGKPPRFEWLAIKDLCVDPLYQRDITAAGRRNILKIAQQFNWTSFSAVLVAPAGVTGKYKIIDGQHRCHAAMLVGLERVPCQITDANTVEQAQAFHKVNANITRVNPLTTFHALVAAKDADALAVLDIAREGGAIIARYPKRLTELKPRETMVTSELGRFAATQGRGNVVLALRAIIETARPDGIRPGNAGLLKHEFIGATACAIAARAHWGEAAILAAFGSFDLGYVSTSTGGQGTRLNAIAAEIARRLDRHGLKHGLRPKDAMDMAARPGPGRKISLAPVPSLSIEARD